MKIFFFTKIHSIFILFILLTVDLDDIGDSAPLATDTVEVDIEDEVIGSSTGGFGNGNILFPSKQRTENLLVLFGFCYMIALLSNQFAFFHSMCFRYFKFFHE